MASASTQSQIRSQPNEKRPGDNGSGSGSARSGGSGSIGIRNPKPNKRIEHITTIAAPIDVVWKSLVNVQDWTWNQWTRLDIGAQTPVNGLKGKLKACYEGNDKDWQTFDFELDVGYFLGMFSARHATHFLKFMLILFFSIAQ